MEKGNLEGLGEVETLLPDIFGLASEYEEIRFDNIKV